jgi:putative hydrolase of the HAD superfamily
VLPRLRRIYGVGCVTNGRAVVQRNKLRGLQAGDLFDAVVVADELGREYWKPHPLPLPTLL